MTDVHHDIAAAGNAPTNVTGPTDNTRPGAAGDKPILPRSRTVLLFVLASALSVGGFVLSVAFTIPSNVLFTRDGDHPVRTAFNLVDPQDWAFFTRDPEGTQIGAYTAAEKDSAVYSLMATPQGAVTNLYGLSRTQRAQGPELGFLNAAVHDWLPCDEPALTCIASTSSTPPITAASTSPVPTICGDIVLTEEHTTPWSFRHFSADKRRVTATAHLNVTCGR